MEAIKQIISQEPDTDLAREVTWLVMIEDLRSGHYELQFNCKILKPNGNVLSEKIVPYKTGTNVKYKMGANFTWTKIRCEDLENPPIGWDDPLYVEESTFFFNIMNKTVKPVSDEVLKKKIILNLDQIDKLFDK